MQVTFTNLIIISNLRRHETKIGHKIEITLRKGEKYNHHLQLRTEQRSVSIEVYTEISEEIIVDQLIIPSQ